MPARSTSSTEYYSGPRGDGPEPVPIGKRVQGVALSRRGRSGGARTSHALSEIRSAHPNEAVSMRIYSTDSTPAAIGMQETEPADSPGRLARIPHRFARFWHDPCAGRGPSRASFPGGVRATDGKPAATHEPTKLAAWAGKSTYYNEAPDPVWTRGHKLVFRRNLLCNNNVRI
jgi:hypothetical protein